MDKRMWRILLSFLTGIIGSEPLFHAHSMTQWEIGACLVFTFVCGMIVGMLHD